MVAHWLEQRLASLAQLAAEPSREAVVPGRLGEQSPGMCIARLGDRAAVNAIAAGMLGRHEAEIAHQLASTAEAVNVTDLGDQANGADRVDAAQGAQRCDDALEAPAPRGFGQRRRRSLHALPSRLGGELVLGQRDTVGLVIGGNLAIQRSWLLGP